MGSHKFRNLKVNPGAKSSRFVIDLKQDLEAVESQETRNKKNLIVESKLEKLAELDYKKYFGMGKEKAPAVSRRGSQSRSYVSKITSWRLLQPKLPWLHRQK